jgi:hypothetical protein
MPALENIRIYFFHPPLRRRLAFDFGFAFSLFTHEGLLCRSGIL